MTVRADKRQGKIISFKEAFKSTKDKRAREILELRFVENMPLESIGKKYGLSRERVRQIIKRELESGKFPELREQVQKYVKRIVDVRKTPWYHEFDGKAITNFMTYVFKMSPFKLDYILVPRDKYVEVERLFKSLQEDIVSHVSVKEFKRLLAKKGFETEEFDAVFEVLGVLIEDGMIVGFKHLTTQQNVIAALNGVRKPVHIKELQKLLQKYFEATGKRFSTVRGLLNPRFMQGRKRRLPLILFDRGTYISEKVFIEKVAEFAKTNPIDFLESFAKEVADIVLSKGIKEWMDVLYLYDLLKQELSPKNRKFLEKLTPYLLKDILVLYGPFVRGRKFEIRLDTNGDVARIKYSDLIYKFIKESPQGILNINEIMRKFQEAGKKPRWYVVIMTIQNDDRFIKVGHATYALRENFAPDAERIIDSVVEALEERRCPTFYTLLLSHLSENFPYVSDWSHHPLYWLLRKQKEVVLLSEKIYAHQKFVKPKTSFYEWLDEKYLRKYDSPLPPEEVKKFLKKLENELGGFDESVKHQLLYTSPVCVYFAGWLVPIRLLNEPEQLEGFFEEEISTFLENISRIAEGGSRRINKRKLELFRKFLEWYEKKNKKVARKLMRALNKVCS